MRACTTTLLLALVSTTAFVAQGQPYDPDWFQKLNPGYVDRAGKFYEGDYLPGAAKNMAKAATHPALTETKAALLLKGHIYKFLNLYVAGNGSLTRAECSRLAGEFDRAVKELLQDDKAYNKFLKWRASTSRDENPLEFLFNHSFKLNIPLSAELITAGWTLENITEVAQLEQQQGHTGFAPDQVLVYQNTKVQNATLTLLLYPRERITLMALKKGPNANGKLATGLQPFWNLSNNTVIYVLEGGDPASQAPLTVYLRGQLLLH